MYSEDCIDNIINQVTLKPSCIRTHEIRNDHGLFCKNYYGIDPFNCHAIDEDLKILNYYKKSHTHSSIRPVIVVRTINCYNMDEAVSVYSIYDDKMTVSDKMNFNCMHLIREYPEIETPTGALIPQKFIYLANVIFIKK